MLGKRFFKWTVIKEIAIGKPGKHYECICDCGNIRIKAGTELRAGKGKQCSECQYAELYNPQKNIGKKFGNWTVLKFIDIYKNSYRYEVQCICGFKKLYVLSELKRGRSKECHICSNRRKAQNNITHGQHDTLLYKVWCTMLQRCNNPNDNNYHNYGGRGIAVCERWRKFENFLADMGPRPNGMTIDRIDNDGNYEPGNCRWVTHKENCNNRKRKKTPPEQGFEKVL